MRVVALARCSIGVEVARWSVVYSLEAHGVSNLDNRTEMEVFPLLNLV